MGHEGHLTISGAQGATGVTPQNDLQVKRADRALSQYTAQMCLLHTRVLVTDRRATRRITDVLPRNCDAFTVHPHRSESSMQPQPATKRRPVCTARMANSHNTKGETINDWFRQWMQHQAAL
jgi:hypothetical protein